MYIWYGCLYIALQRKFKRCVLAEIMLLLTQAPCNSDRKQIRNQRAAKRFLSVNRENLWHLLAKPCKVETTPMLDKIPWLFHYVLMKAK